MRSPCLPLLLTLTTASALAHAEAPAFPLRVSADGRWLIDARERPFLYQADTAWKLFVALTLDEADEYLRARRDQGFTAIQVVLTGFVGDRNRAGHLPFDGEHDFARPNEAYFAHVDAVLARARKVGLAVWMAPLWAGCCGEGWAGKGKDGRAKPMNVNGPEKTRAFGRWLGRRYGGQPHVSWILGGDNDPGASRDVIRALAEGIDEAAPRQLMTYHAASSHSSTDVWPADERWLDVSMIYTYFRGFDKAWNKNQPDVYEAAARERAKPRPRPFFLGESTYEGEHGAWGSARQARKQAYWAMLGGATGHAYGSPNWRLDGDWRKTLRLPGAESLRHLRALFTARPFHALVPDTANALAVGGRGPFASNDHATTALAADGRFAVSYLPGPRALELDLGKLRARGVRASWVDPRTGAVTDAGVRAAPGRGTFRPPAGAADDDWLLVVDDADANLPPLGSGPQGAAPVARGIDDQGFVRDWLVLAPVPFPHVETGTAELAARQIPDEATMRPVAGQYVRFPGRELVWLEHQAPEPAIDFAKFVNEARALEALGYAVAYLVADRARGDLQLKMGSAKQAKVYVNGKALLVHAAPRPYRADQDVAPLSLAKGLNVVVFKVVNTGGAWRGSVRIVDGAGQAPADVKVAVHPRRDVADLFPLDPQGYVRSWLLLAPIAYVPPTVGKGVAARPLLPGEAALRPAAGERVTVGGKALAWQAVSAKSSELDLAAVAGAGEHRAVAAYAVAYIVAPQEMKRLKLKSGSNDHARVYLNGKPVVTFDAPRALRADQDVATGVTLRKGVNVVVFKVLNTERKWAAILRFTDAQDRPVTTLSALHAPPAS